MKIVKKILTTIILIILLCILFVSGVIIVNSYVHPNEVPSFFGWKPFIVLSGSMEKEILTGDMVIVKEVDTSTLKEGDIIAFKSDDIVITHRILRIENVDGEVRYITKGDNNNTEDTSYVLPKNVEGLYKFRIGRLGNLAMFMQTPTGMVVCISIPLIMLILIQAIGSKKERKLMKQNEDIQKNMEQEIEELKKQNEELSKK
jgi:signal peptidase